MRVGFFNVPYLETFGWMKRSAPIYVPLGTASLAAFLKREGHDVAAVACDLSRISIDEGMERLLAFEPDVIGISATTPGYPMACELARRFKERTRTPICLGGIHASARPGECLNECGAIDAVVAGEGERPLSELVRRLESGLPLSGPAPPAGVYWRNGHSGVVWGAPGQFLSDLDTLPFPAYGIFDVHNSRPPVYFDFGLHPSVNIMTSRGCPSKCIYCSSKLTMGTRYRPFSAGYVFELIRYLKKDFGVRFVSFTDDTFTLQKRRAHELCERLRRAGMGIQWTCFSRADGMDRDLAMAMRGAGCVGVNFGIETGSAAMLARIGKGSRLVHSTAAVAAAREAGLRTVCSFMTGLPEETMEMAEETIDFAVKLNPDLALFNSLVPYPGTPVAEEMMRPEDYEGIDWTLMRTSTTGAGPLVGSGRRSAADLARWVKRANRKFYLRWGFFAKIFRLMPRSFGAAIRCLSGMMGMVVKTVCLRPARGAGARPAAAGRMQKLSKKTLRPT